jgi:hypothetical protein
MPPPLQFKNEGDDLQAHDKEGVKHGSQSPSVKNVEFHGATDQIKSKKTDRNPHRLSHAKRADQFGLLLLVGALVVLVVVFVGIYFNQQRYLYQTSQPVETSTASLDFYRGDHVFSQKLEEEKAAKLDNKGHEVHGISTVNDNLEVSLTDQMNSMSEKMDKMRSEEKSGEAPPPTPDTGFNTNSIDLKPTTIENFEAPRKLDGTLPKALQTSQ